MDEHKIPRLAEASIQYKPSVPLDEMPVIRSADDVVKLVIGGWEEIYGRETVKALLLTSNNMVLGEKVITSKLEEDAEYTPALSDGYAVRGIRTIGIGGISNTSVDIKTALQAAMLGNAVGMIEVRLHEDTQRRLIRIQREAFHDGLLVRLERDVHRERRAEQDATGGSTR